MPKRVISRFSIENLLSHSTEKLRIGTLPSFTKFLVSNKFMDKRGEGSGGRGKYQDFPSKRGHKNFVGEPFKVSLSSGVEKFYASECYVTIFCRNFFVSQCRKNS